MLTVRGIETRLRKLEAKRRPPEGVFFLVWGHDAVEIERNLATAKARGEVGRGDTIIRARWTGHNGGPESRWIANCRSDLSPAEDDVLTAALERLCAEVHSPEEIAASATAPRDLRVSQMSDAQLLAVALGEPLQ